MVAFSGFVRRLAGLALLLAAAVDTLECPVQGRVVALCPMCTDSNAAVRWSSRGEFTFFQLIYTCSTENGTTVFRQDGDSCFNSWPFKDNKPEQHSGVCSIGHRLWTGLQCSFTARYRTQSGRVSETLTQSCTIQTTEMCEAEPQDCVIDRISEMNGDGECHYNCTEGYEGYLCNNIDECERSNGCDNNSECHDTDGSYWCQCLPGFQGDGYNCADIDECLNVTVTCGENAECLNTEGSYSCQCKSGFTGDGYNCTDMNECLDMCVDENSQCINTEGSFSCLCSPGFTGNGYNCADINECLDVTCGENAECLNTEGNYSCQCMSGFTGDGYSNCTDVDECMEGIYSCSSNDSCLNLPGTYSCHCPSGFSWNGSQCHMQDISTRESVGMVAVLAGGLLAVLLPPLLVATLIIIVCRCNRTKKLSFESLAENEIDPEYHPKFLSLSGSVMSIQSVYDKIVLSESANEDSYSDEESKQQMSIHDDMEAMVGLLPPGDQRHADVEEKESYSDSVAQPEVGSAEEKSNYATSPPLVESYKLEDTFDHNNAMESMWREDSLGFCGDFDDKGAHDYTTESDLENHGGIADTDIQDCPSSDCCTKSTEINRLSSGCREHQQILESGSEYYSTATSSGYGSYLAKSEGSTFSLDDAESLNEHEEQSLHPESNIAGISTLTSTYQTSFSVNDTAATDSSNAYSYAFQHAEEVDPESEANGATSQSQNGDKNPLPDGGIDCGLDIHQTTDYVNSVDNDSFLKDVKFDIVVS